MAKNIDYKDSAVNLCNAPEIKEALDKYLILQEAVRGLEKEAQSYIPEDLTRQITDSKGFLAQMETNIKNAVEQFGSYQDIENGHYAIKQRRISITYIPDKVKTIMPDFARAVIEEVVNKVKIAGLLKGGLITPEQHDAVSEKAESYAFIIK